MQHTAACSRINLASNKRNKIRWKPEARCQRELTRSLLVKFSLPPQQLTNMPLFTGDKYKALAILLVLGGWDTGTSLSTSIQSNTKKLTKPKGSPPRKQSKQWRYSQPKSSRWDIRHTKSFRFDLQTLSSSIHSMHDSLPMHKKPRESLSHVLGKGILWALFQDEYGAPPKQTILVETPIPQEPRFVPDVVAFDVPTPATVDVDRRNLNIPASHSTQQQQRPDYHEFVKDHQPTFWGESGRMSAEKAAALAWKYPHTHFVHLRWGSQVSMDIFEDIETAVLPSLQHRTAPFEFALLNDKPQHFVEEDGTVSLRKEDLQWRTARFDIDLNY